MLTRPLTRPLVRPLTRRVTEPGFGGWSPRVLFTSGEQGAWYDPSDLSTLYQDSAGTTPVTALGQPVGLMLDKSKGLVLGPELREGITLFGQALSIGENEYRITDTDGVYDAVRFTLPADSRGKFYRVEYEILRDESTGGAGLKLEYASGGASVALDTATGLHSLIRQRGDDPTNSLSIARSRIGTDVDFRVISVRELPGNHASQPTATARPTLQADASGRKYLQFDGVDDFLVTGNIDFTATDKMTVVAGVRKESDAALAMLMELSTNSAVNPGSFYWLAPAIGAGTYQWCSVGSTPPAQADVSGFPAGISHVLTGIGGISTDTSIARVNGMQVGQSAADQGTGSYGNYPLYIGHRSGSSLPFNGRLYSLLVRGALSTQAQIEAAERYANTRTGAY